MWIDEVAGILTRCYITTGNSQQTKRKNNKPLGFLHTKNNEERNSNNDNDQTMVGGIVDEDEE